jgi:hypothetical protein
MDPDINADAAPLDQGGISQKGSSGHRFIIGFIFLLFIVFIINLVLVGVDDPRIQSTLDEERNQTNIASIPLQPTAIQNVCDMKKAQYLPAFIEITPAVYVTRTVQKRTIIGTGVKTDIITTNDHIITDPNGKPPTAKEILEFKAWVGSRGIALIPTYRSYEELINGKFNLKNDQVPIEQIGQVMNAYQALKLLPAPIIEKMRGTAIYMSTVNDNTNYALYSHESPEEIAKMYKKNQNVVRNGIFLVQPISKRVTIHEIGHLIGTIGINGLFGDEYSTYKDLRSEYENVFEMNGLQNLPCGYITSYSTTNDAENFADHFSYYVIYGKEFRERAATDPLLMAKYTFFKDSIFEGKEY